MRTGREPHDLVTPILAASSVAEGLTSTLRRVIELTPNDAMAYTSLSIFLQRMNRIEEAEAAQAKARMISWKEELKTNPKAPPPEDPKGIRVVQ